MIDSYNFGYLLLKWDAIINLHPTEKGLFQKETIIFQSIIFEGGSCSFWRGASILPGPTLLKPTPKTRIFGAKVRLPKAHPVPQGVRIMAGGRCADCLLLERSFATVFFLSIRGISRFFRGNSAGVKTHETKGVEMWKWLQVSR